MKPVVTKERFLKEERGFSLSEMMVTVMIMIVVFLALYSIFDMSVRIFSFSNDKVEAVENARLGLEKMEREIRQAYPYEKTAQSIDWFPTGVDPDSITFWNDLNGDNTLDSATEEITYGLSGECPATLLRNGQPMVEFVQDADPPDDPDNPCDGPALTFEYLDEAGDPTAVETDIRMVLIRLEVAVDRGIQEKPVTQTLTTVVALRNRGES